MIAVTFALPSESSDFVRRLEGRTQGPPGSHTIFGTLHGRVLKILHTGVGEKTTRARLPVFLHEHAPRLLISAGFTGALNDRLKVGDVFLADNFSDAESARECALPRAILTSTSEVIESPAERERLARKSGALAVDMETAWIAEACRAADVPMLSIRAISDSSAEPLPAPASVLFDLDEQRTPIRKLAFHLLLHPQRLLALIKFARRIAHARRNLTDALVEICAG